MSTWKKRRGAHETAERDEEEFLREIEDRLKRPSMALLRAAAAPEPLRPHLLIKLPIEGSAEVTFVAPGHGELVRLLDWLDSGPYAAIAETLRSRERR